MKKSALSSNIPVIVFISIICIIALAKLIFSLVSFELLSTAPEENKYSY